MRVSMATVGWLLMLMAIFASVARIPFVNDTTLIILAVIGAAAFIADS